MNCYSARSEGEYEKNIIIVAGGKLILALVLRADGTRLNKLCHIALIFLGITLVSLIGYAVTDVLADPGTLACKLGAIARHVAQWTGFVSLVAGGLWVMSLAARAKR